MKSSHGASQRRTVYSKIQIFDRNSRPPPDPVQAELLGPGRPNRDFILKMTYLRAQEELANNIPDLEFSAKIDFLFNFLSKNIHGENFYRDLIYFMCELRCRVPFSPIEEIILRSRSVSSVHQCPVDKQTWFVFEGQLNGQTQREKD